MASMFLKAEKICYKNGILLHFVLLNFMLVQSIVRNSIEKLKFTHLLTFQRIGT